MPTTRQTPNGLKPADGFSTLLAFDLDPDIAFWEKTVKPPGIDGGDAIDTTTMHNTAWRTMAPRSIKTLTEITTKVTYDAKVYDQILALINVNGLITIHFPDNATLDFYGYLKSFTPAENSEGAQPEADIVITPTNTNSSTGAESAPNYITGSGTD